MWKFLKITFVSFILFITIGGYYAAKNILPYAIIQPYRAPSRLAPSDFNLEASDISIITLDSIKLLGYNVKPKLQNPKAIMILMHGIGGCKEHFLSLSGKLADLGVESYIFDSRAHGKSEGKYCTYGFKEKEDIGEIIDLIKSKNDSVPIGVWGNSMGGAIAIQALELDKRIEFGIIESTFIDLDQIVYDYQKRMTYGIGLYPLCTIALEEAGEIVKFNPDSVNPLMSVKNINQPVLIAHGNKDENIKFEYGEALYKKTKIHPKAIYKS